MNLKQKVYTTFLLFFLASLLAFPTGCRRSVKVDIDSLRDENSEYDLAALDVYNQVMPLPDHPLTLEDILCIVFEHNLDVLTEEYERRVQEELTIAEELKMLPPLTLDGIFQERSKNTASNTKILGGTAPPGTIQPQLASTRETRQWDARLTLDLIDFGLSYFKSKQERDRTFIIDQQHLRARQKLILETITAYWHVVVAQKVMNETIEVINLSKKFQEGFDRQIGRKNISEILGLVAESRIVDAQMQLNPLIYQYYSAKAELASLMGYPPETCFEVADVELKDPELDICDITELEEQALKSRPELSVKDLEQKIARESVRMAILQMCPNPSLFVDYDVDANPFLVFNRWMSAGVKATINLLNIPQQLHLKHAAQTQAEQTYASRLALSIAIMAQVHIAYIGYRDALDTYRLADQSYQLKSRLATAAEKEKRLGEFNGVDTLSFVADATIAKINAFKAYASLQVAIEQLDYTIGIPLLFADTELDGITLEHYRMDCIDKVEEECEDYVDDCCGASTTYGFNLNNKFNWGST